MELSSKTNVSAGIRSLQVLIVGLMILFAAFFPINANAPAPASAYVIAGMMIVGAILWMCIKRHGWPHCPRGEYSHYYGEQRDKLRRSKTLRNRP